MTDRFRIGKLPPEFLAELLGHLPMLDRRVVVGPRVGEDAAVIDFGEQYLVAKTDPITFASDQIGWYAVNINANDIATMGATPRWFLATLLLPSEQTTRDLVEGIFVQIGDACRDLGISLCGGHTEITYGLDHPIVVGVMLGEVERDRLVTSSGARVGDEVIVTKGIAVEATALIAREKEAMLRDKFAPDFLDRCRRFLFAPGLSVVRDAAIAMRLGGVHAMHDPTEGGLAMSLWELAWASEVGLVIDHEVIPVLPECTRLADEFGLDPLGCIASGSLLIVAAPEKSAAICEALAEAGVLARCIGRVVAKSEGVTMRVGGEQRSLPQFARDEIARLFE